MLSFVYASNSASSSSRVGALVAGAPRRPPGAPPDGPARPAPPTRL